MSSASFNQQLWQWGVAMWNGKGGCGQRCSWLRGSGAPLHHEVSCSVLQDFMSIHDPFVGHDSQRCPCVVCGAEDMLSRGAVVWAMGWVPKSTPASAWDSWVRTCGRDRTSLVTSTPGSWLSPEPVWCLSSRWTSKYYFFFLLGVFCACETNSLCPLVSRYPYGLWCSLLWAPGCVPWGSVGDTAIASVNNSNSCFRVCLISKVSSVLCQRQWWAVLSFPVFSVLAQYQWCCHEEPEAGGHRGCPFSRSRWVQQCWTSSNPEGRDCPSTVTVLGHSLCSCLCSTGHGQGKAISPGKGGRKFRRWDSRKQFCDPELCLFLFLLWLCVGKACV